LLVNLCQLFVFIIDISDPNRTNRLLKGLDGSNHLTVKNCLQNPTAGAYDTRQMKIFCDQGSISPTYLRSAFTLVDPESVKRLMT